MWRTERHEDTTLQFLPFQTQRVSAEDEGGTRGIRDMYVLRIRAGETRKAHVRKLRACCSSKGKEGAESGGVKLRCRVSARSRQRNARASADATSPAVQPDAPQLQSSIREMTEPCMKRLPGCGMISHQGCAGRLGPVCRWHVCLTCNQGEREIAPDCESAVGPEWSVDVPITLLDGTSMEPDPGLETLEDEARRERQKLSRCKRGSKRRRRRVAGLAATRRKQAARSKGRAHSFTTRVVRERSVTAIEATSVRDLTASAKGTRAKPGKLVLEMADVNRRILDVAPCQTRRMLECKAARRRGKVMRSHPRPIVMQSGR